MEPVKSFPKWFWLAIAVIAAVTIISIVYCNYKQKRLTVNVSDALKDVEPVNAIDQIPTIQTSL